MITKKNRQFLIIWICTCCFALLCNVIPIRGVLYKGDYEEKRAAIFLFTSGSSRNFWPFTNDFINDQLFINEEGNLSAGTLEPNGFEGVFNEFDYPEFFVYVLLGLAIVFVPKFWNKE